MFEHEKVMRQWMDEESERFFEEKDDFFTKRKHIFKESPLDKVFNGIFTVMEIGSAILGVMFLWMAYEYNAGHYQVGESGAAELLTNIDNWTGGFLSESMFILLIVSGIGFILYAVLSYIIRRAAKKTFNF